MHTRQFAPSLLTGLCGFPKGNSSWNYTNHSLPLMEWFTPSVSVAMKEVCLSRQNMSSEKQIVKSSGEIVSQFIISQLVNNNNKIKLFFYKILLFFQYTTSYPSALTVIDMMYTILEQLQKIRQKKMQFWQTMQRIIQVWNRCVQTINEAVHQAHSQYTWK